MDLGLKDRVALVAASSRGLGRACAMELAREGARVVLCSRNAERLAATAGEIAAATGREPFWMAIDLRQPAQIQHLVDEALRRYGRIDVLVTNNGGPPPGYFEDLDDAAWQAAHELTLMSAVRLIRAVLPAMRVQGWGRIISLTSVSTKQPMDDLIFSNVYRSGVMSLAKTLSAQVAGDGITINTVAPGYIRTDRVIELDRARAAREGITVEQVLANRLKDYPIGRMGEPEELAALVAFLASERAAYITGTTIQVDGDYCKGLF